MSHVSLAPLPWQFREKKSKTWLPARVPGCVHADLLEVGKIPDPFFASNEAALQWIGERDWEYQLEFTVDPALLADDELDLVADGLDTLASVFLNGKLLGETDNMFVAHRWPIKGFLRNGQNELRIYFRSATDFISTHRTEFTPPREFCDPVGNAVRIRKQPSQFGWDWAPRLVTAGIWRDIRLESWSKNRIAHLHVRQNHNSDGNAVDLILTPTLARENAAALAGIQISATCMLEGRVVAEGRSSGSGAITLTVDRPKLWWPAGQGAQPLYDLAIVLRSADGKELDAIYRRVGLRTMKLDRHPDQWGETFQIVVNGRPIFAKGANWVPAHSFVSTLNRERYARDLLAAVQANMNCIRLWGGGIYESESFYDLCDELGLMVWHDFIFSCALYPSDPSFLASVKLEATQQLQRLQHRACIAFWCGNNELAQLNLKYLEENASLKNGYLALFHELLPAAVELNDGTRDYWPSSEWRGVFESGHALGEKSGDSHYWDVWHARHPVKDYEKWAFRFCSEFGMQSYSSVATNATFCPPDDTNVFGRSMENHQKNAQGNQVILDYVSRRYRFPANQAALIYLSQLNQAYCMQVGVEHYRRQMPRCMGALYWQLNDCWPAASWSSIEFTGRWKALHFAARRFFAPALATAHVHGDDVARIGNYPTSTVRQVDLFTVYDSPPEAAGLLRWDVMHLSGQTVLTGAKSVALHYGESVKQQVLDLGNGISAHGIHNLYLRLRLEIEQRAVSEQTVFLTAPRYMNLPRAKIDARIELQTPTLATIHFSAPVFHHAVFFDFADLNVQAEDNVFDLYPNETRSIRLRFERPVSAQKMAAALHYQSLVDTYE